MKRLSEYKVRFRNTEEVLEFINKVDRFTYSMDMIKGSSMVVDAKSILGVIALGFDDDMMLRVYSDDCHGLEEVLQPYMAA